ncbi:hypothetical protein SLEP1_g55494 [Rubroshorea leprosula]|uniref:Uncharacterized protein n=1 Tax=Rubroshorea leprosula TaxID=152421 RepID=A0AAV5MGN1_9ROSI|nr:hypothetical protein SLEP1_g55494 [Rubroshorea leprosula]
MLRDQGKEFIPITVLAGIPIMCFVLLQFPLLVEITALTLRPDIFGRKTATTRLFELLAGSIPILASVVDVVKTRLIVGRKLRKFKRQMTNLENQMNTP